MGIPTAPPYRDATLALTSATITWLLGGHPQLSWSAPAGSVDHYRVWSGQASNSSDAVDISGSLSSGTTSFTASSMGFDGLAHYFWIVAYNASETRAGNSTPVAGCAVDFSSTLTSHSYQGADTIVFPNLGLTWPLSLVIGGLIHSALTASFTASHSDTSFSVSASDTLGSQIFIESGVSIQNVRGYSNPALAGQLANVSWPAFSGSGPAGSLTGAAASATNSYNPPGSDPITVSVAVPTPALIQSGWIWSPQGSTSFVLNESGVTLTGLTATAQLTYASPGAVSGGQGVPASFPDVPVVTTAKGQLYMRYVLFNTTLASPPPPPGVGNVVELQSGAGNVQLQSGGGNVELQSG